MHLAAAYAAGLASRPVDFSPSLLPWQSVVPGTLNAAQYRG